MLETCNITVAVFCHHYY